MQNSFQQTPYSGNQPYQAVPEANGPPSSSDTQSEDPEKSPSANFRPSPHRNTIYVPVIKRRFNKKSFVITWGIMGSIFLICVIIGISIGISGKRVGKPGKGEKGTAVGAQDDRSGLYNGKFTGDDGRVSDPDDPNSTDTGNESTNSSGGNGGSGGGGSNSNDPCQQLLDAGAPWQDVSDCLTQQHITTMEIIDNFDGYDDYTYTYTYYPYGGTKKGGKSVKPSQSSKVATVLKLESAGKGLPGKASQFHAKLGGKGSKKPSLHHPRPVAHAGEKLKPLHPKGGVPPQAASIDTALKSHKKPALKPRLAASASRKLKLAKSKRAVPPRSILFEDSPRLEMAYRVLSSD
ncbi:hypothetical protein ABW19_dt0200951 [Dactylella cylindrospora]|nr:hypothetical protein ABW19_dt0200951 [Dactylella cylindrospora]